MNRSLISFCITEISPPSKASVFLRAKCFLPCSLRRRFVYTRLYSMFIRKEVLDCWYCYYCYSTVQMYINKYQFCKKHSGKTLHTHHRAQHKHVYSKLCLSIAYLQFYAKVIFAISHMCEMSFII